MRGNFLNTYPSRCPRQHVMKLELDNAQCDEIETVQCASMKESVQQQCPALDDMLESS